MKFPTSHPWTKSRIDKRRNYLRLVRTKDEVKRVRLRNVESGRFAECAVKRWLKTGSFPDGTVRRWKKNDGGYFEVIKVNSQYFHHNRYVWEQAYGEIPAGMAIRHINGISTDNRLENLEMVTLEENIKRNNIYSNYPPDLIKDIIALARFNKKLKEYEKQNSEPKG
jgi:hypothetical protein